MPESVSSAVIYKSHYLNDELFKGVHATLIAHRHSEIVMSNKRKNLSQLLSHMEKPKFLFDAWNVWREASAISHVDYDALGWGG